MQLFRNVLGEVTIAHALDHPRDEIPFG
jgi:hypothetical protein